MCYSQLTSCDSSLGESGWEGGGRVSIVSGGGGGGGSVS